MVQITERFDENYYLRSNPDVLFAVKIGSISSGYEHFSRWGRAGGRLGFPKNFALKKISWSDKKISTVNSQASSTKNNLRKLIYESYISAINQDEVKSVSATEKIYKYIENLFPMDQDTLNHVILSSVVCSRYDMINYIMSKQYTKYKIKISFNLDKRENKNKNLVIFSVGENKCLDIAMDESILGGDNTDFFLNHTFMSIVQIFEYVENGGGIGRTKINIGDMGDGSGLAYCSQRKDVFLIPDNYFISSGGYAELKNSFLKSYVPFSERRPFVFWRGATTGRYGDSWRDLPRVRLCEIAKTDEGADFFDIGLSKIVQFHDNDVIESIKNSGYMKSSVFREEFLKYKIQVDIDGNSNSWPGFFLKLLTGSPVLKVESPFGFRQWYYARLIPWFHYVPVKSDLSDFTEKAMWLFKNSKDAEWIGQNGRRFALELSMDSEMRYAHDVIGASIRYFRNVNF